MTDMSIGDIELAVASVLYKEVIGDGGLLTPTEVGEKMHPRLGRIRVEHGLDILEHHCYVWGMRSVDIRRLERVYRLNPAGVQWFEGLHKRRRRLIFNAYLEQQDIDWTKWGTIAAWLAIPVGAMVAIAIAALS
jgi:hypothetical protein